MGRISTYKSQKCRECEKEAAKKGIAIVLNPLNSTLYCEQKRQKTV